MRATAIAASSIDAADTADLKKLARQASHAAALSQHLARLRADGLVTFHRTSQTLHYRVGDQNALRLSEVLKQIYCGSLK